jgi:hypothetical protein
MKEIKEFLSVVNYCTNSDKIDSNVWFECIYPVYGKANSITSDMFTMFIVEELNAEYD